MTTQTPNKIDIAIVGGGMVGMTMAATLAPLGLAIMLIDQADPARFREADFDGRSSAIAFGSQRLLQRIGLWPLLADQAAPILDIRVTDGKLGQPASSLFLHYDHRTLGDEPLGFIIENNAIRRGLLALLAGLENPPLHLAPARLDRIAFDQAGADLLLEGGQTVRAKLVIAADGRDSMIRQFLNIPVTRWDYPQMGIVCTLGHDYPHDHVAHEHFLPSGPFAILPMTNAADGTHRSSLVWTERKDHAQRFLSLSESEFAQEVEFRFGSSLGHFTVLSKRFGHRLEFQHAASYIAPRAALIGDAAHVIHPIAGQGLNLGLRDIAALAECIADTVRLGLDFGDAATLARYQRWRRGDNWMLAATTDGLNRLFSNDWAPVRLGRDLGLAAVNRMPGLKRFFMRHAMGVVGDLPRLIKGEAL